MTWPRPEHSAVRRELFRWARRYERPLPWRGEKDPYRVLVSEVMLQQTQASRVADAYPRFLERFPTVAALAEARSADVLRAWGNLGYNRRALNLWRCARAIVERGAFPRTVEGLAELPGIGPYTSRAVASFAFGADAAVVEANVRRVLSRTYGLPADADVQSLAEEVVPVGRAAQWNQVLMDFGAMVCRPRAPACSSCGLRSVCAFANGFRRARPVAQAPLPFTTTTRYARGRVMQVLRESTDALSLTVLTTRTGLTRRRARSAVDGLHRDGLVSCEADRVRLG